MCGVWARVCLSVPGHAGLFCEGGGWVPAVDSHQDHCHLQDVDTGATAAFGQCFLELEVVRPCVSLLP